MDLGIFKIGDYVDLGSVKLRLLTIWSFTFYHIWNNIGRICWYILSVSLFIQIIRSVREVLCAKWALNNIYDTFKIYSHILQDLFKCWFSLIILIVVITFICVLFIGVIFLLMAMLFCATYLSYSTAEENGVLFWFK